MGARTTIYDKVPASVDGAFRAIFRKDGEILDEAVLLLPYNGSARKQTLTGICLDGPEEKDIEEVIFEPVKLWAVER